MRILQTGDWHLGRKLNQHPQNPFWAETRSEELWKMAERIVTLANNRSDLLLLCGDIYEKNRFRHKDMLRLKEILSNSINPVCVIGGNHDYMDKDSLWYQVEWPEHIYLLHSGEVLDISGVSIAGYSWTSPYVPKMDKIPEVDVLMLHGDMDEGSSYFIGSKAQWLSLPVKYIALGHIHKAYVIEGKIGCSGSPEPLAMSEYGDHGIFILDIADDKKYVKIDAVKTAQRNVIEVEVNLNRHTSYFEVEKILSEQGVGRNDMVKLSWKGADIRAKQLDLLEKKLASAYEFILFKRNLVEENDLKSLEDLIDELRQLMEIHDESLEMIEAVTDEVRRGWEEVTFDD